MFQVQPGETRKHVEIVCVQFGESAVGQIEVVQLGEFVKRGGIQVHDRIPGQIEFDHAGGHWEHRRGKRSELVAAQIEVDHKGILKQRRRVEFMQIIPVQLDEREPDGARHKVRSDVVQHIVAKAQIPETQTFVDYNWTKKVIGESGEVISREIECVHILDVIELQRDQQIDLVPAEINDEDLFPAEHLGIHPLHFVIGHEQMAQLVGFRQKVIG